MKAGDYVLAAERIRAEAMERPGNPSGLDSCTE